VEHVVPEVSSPEVVTPVAAEPLQVVKAAAAPQQAPQTHETVEATVPQGTILLRVASLVSHVCSN